ncbi:MAG: SDR family NAD(P)-dependent oxidoreductase [Acidimicrobiales bacterium]
MNIDGCTALVTGANRGLGRHLAEQLRDRGAHVYATARNPDSIELAGVMPLALDITDATSISDVARRTGDVSLLINNAGSSTGAGPLTGPLEDIHLEMDTHYFGTLLMARAFAPQLATHDESAMLNVHSVLSWLRCVLRRQVSGVVTHQQPAPGTLRAGHQGELFTRGLYGHGHGPQHY